MCALSFQLLRRRCAPRECGPGVLKGLAERSELQSNLLHLQHIGINGLSRVMPQMK